MREESEQKPASLESLDEQLAAAKKLMPETSRATKKLPGDAARAAIDFASATAVGLGLGYGFDAWLNTTPWGLIGGLVIGVATGMKLMLEEEKRQKRQSDKEQEKTD